MTQAADRSDAELLAMMQRDVHLLERVQCAATAAHARTRALPFAPVDHIDLLWVGARRKTVDIGRSGLRDFSNSAADQAAQVQLLRIAMDVIRAFQAFASMTSDQRRAALPGYQAQAQLRAYAAEQNAIAIRGAAALASMPAWSASAFIRSLAQKGIGLTVSPDGGLMATGSTQLTAADRETLKVRKAAIVDELSTTEMVA